MKYGMMTVILFAVLGMSTSSAWSAAELAKVNGKPITVTDLQGALTNYNEGQRENILKDAASRRQVLMNVIDQEILAQQGEKDKVDQGSEYSEALKAFRKQYMVTQVLHKALGSKMTDKEAKEYYKIHKLKYSTDQVHAQHILVSDEAQAKELIKKAKEPGTDFQALAQEVSKDPSAKNNRGDLGFFTRDRMVPEFTEAAFRASAGEIIGPVKTSFGYHIIKVVEKKPGHAMEFDEVEMQVKNDLQAELIKNYVGKLKENAKIQIDEAALKKSL